MLGSVLSSTIDTASILTESSAFTGFTGGGGDVLGELIANRRRFGLTVAPIHVGNHPFKSMSPFKYRASVIDIRELNFFATAALQNDVAMLLGQLVEGLSISKS